MAVTDGAAAARKSDKENNGEDFPRTGLMSRAAKKVDEVEQEASARKASEAVRRRSASEDSMKDSVTEGLLARIPRWCLPRWFADLSEKTLANTLEYKHKKMPLSPVDHYVVTPIGQMIARQLPRSISPNSISLFGGFCAIMAACLVLAGATLSSPTAHILAGVFWLSYQLADVTDGAHARGTGQGSPLGGIVDHCCDAVVCTFGALSACTACDPTATAKALCVRTATMLLVAFFGAQWAEHAGQDFDDRGVVEANLFTAVAIALPGLWRMDVYYGTVNVWLLGELPLGHAACCGVFLFACWQGVSRVVQVVWNTKKVGLLLDFVPILMHWIAAEVFCHYMGEVSVQSWVIITAMSYTGMSVSAMKMRLAATVSASWPVWHAEAIAPCCLAALIVAGVPVGMPMFVLGFLWQASVMVMLWCDMVTRICKLLDIPFLAPLPLRRP